MQEKQEIRLSQAAPVLPTGPATIPAQGKMYGVTSPASAPTTPSVYNKKLTNLFRGRLVVLPAECNVAEALERLAYHNVTSAPVIKTDQDNKIILGFLDTLDILAHLCNLGSSEEGFQNLLKGDSFKNTQISELVDLSKRNSFNILHGDTSLSDAIDFFLKDNHRICITDNNGEVTGVISQWTVANYLATVPTDDKEWIPTLHAPIGETNFKTDNVLCCPASTKVFDAFVSIHKNKISGIGVTNEQGKLVGNLSASDLKGFLLFEKDFNNLNKPVGEFINNIRRLQNRPENFVACCDKSTKVIDIVKMLNKELIHRVYLVDENMAPSGLVSLTDIMRAIVVKDMHTSPNYASLVVQKEKEQELHQKELRAQQEA